MKPCNDFIREAIQMEVLQTLLTEMRIYPDSEGKLRLCHDGPFLTFDAYAPGQPDGDGWKVYAPGDHAWHSAYHSTKEGT